MRASAWGRRHLRRRSTARRASLLVPAGGDGFDELLAIGLLVRHRDQGRLAFGLLCKALATHVRHPDLHGSKAACPHPAPVLADSMLHRHAYHVTCNEGAAEGGYVANDARRPVSTASVERPAA